MADQKDIIKEGKEDNIIQFPNWIDKTWDHVYVNYRDEVRGRRENVKWAEFYSANSYLLMAHTEYTGHASVIDGILRVHGLFIGGPLGVVPNLYESMSISADYEFHTHPSKVGPVSNFVSLEDIMAGMQICWRGYKASIIMTPNCIISIEFEPEISDLVGLARDLARAKKQFEIYNSILGEYTFQSLADNLKNRGITINVVYGQATTETASYSHNKVWLEGLSKFIEDLEAKK